MLYEVTIQVRYQRTKEIFRAHKVIIEADNVCHARKVARKFYKGRNWPKIRETYLQLNPRQYKP